jgi:hypothetical protein
VAYVYYGSAAGLSANPDWIGSGDDERYSEQFGHSVGTAGDVNGDGFDDVIVGAIGSENFGGRAYVYFGSSAGLRINPALRVKNFQTNAELGYSVGTAGDVNGDGLDDIIVGSPLFNETKPMEASPSCTTAAALALIESRPLPGQFSLKGVRPRPD